MSFLHVYHEADGDQPLLSTQDAYRISLEMSAVEVYFDRRPLMSVPLGGDHDQLKVAHRDVIDKIQTLSGRQHAELRGMSPYYPDLELRRELLCTESADEEESWHLLLRGQAIFYLHLESRVYVVGCEQGDLMSIPGGMPHWLDIGPEPDFLMMTLSNAESPSLVSTASDIALRFPRYERLVESDAA
ncbi:cupin [Salinicola rhizosphaerae]|uniref:Acireductone dioxygenase n=1 Tax=Salinicola rhizosphaerae TaxID=1443141 RepID=A0ABQ3DX69_9GAMM|nr:cupin [Salinicola rhizosphaerae]GHB17909.1 acireductone dioxygenase [Salinicola rhizosphaerae]